MGESVRTTEWLVGRNVEKVGLCDAESGLTEGKTRKIYEGDVD